MTHEQLHGYYVLQYGAERYTAIAWYATLYEAERHVKQLKDSGAWHGMPPKIEACKTHNTADCNDAIDGGAR